MIIFCGTYYFHCIQDFLICCAFLWLEIECFYPYLSGLLNLLWDSHTISPLTSTIWVNETTKNLLFTQHKTNYKKHLFKFYEPYCIHILLSLHMGVLVFTGSSPTQIWFPLSIWINKHQRTCLLIPKHYRRLPECLTLTLRLGSIKNICITVRKHELILIMMWLIHWCLGKWLSFWKCYLNLQNLESNH